MTAGDADTLTCQGPVLAEAESAELVVAHVFSMKNVCRSMGPTTAPLPLQILDTPPLYCCCVHYEPITLRPGATERSIPLYPLPTNPSIAKGVGHCL